MRAASRFWSPTRERDVARHTATFLERGYIVVELPGLIPVPGELLVTYDGLIAKAEELGALGLAPARRSTRVEASGRGWSWGCDHIHAPAFRRQVLLDLVALDPIPALVTRILGRRVRFCGMHGHWSPASYDYYLHWHRDTRRERWHLGHADRRAHVQVCIALREEAAVWVVPGSHFRDLTATEQDLVAKRPHEPHPAQEIIAVPEGHALLLNTYTLHRAQCAREHVRRSLHFGFARVGASFEPGRQVKWWPWLEDPEFLAQQPPFLRDAVVEQTRCARAELVPREGGA